MAVFKNAVGIPDQDAINFINAAGFSSPTEMGAINKLVLDLKGFFNPNYPTSDIWNKMKAIYPMVGGTAFSQKYNLKNPNTFTGTFVGGWIHSSTGDLPNGVNAYMDTGIIPNNELSLNETPEAIIILRQNFKKINWHNAINLYQSSLSNILIACIHSQE